MKTFEENLTAWIDGELSDAERAQFEASLEDRAAAETEKAEALQLGNFLRAQIGAREMGNEEFFHHQLRERIARETAEESAGTSDVPVMRETWWSIRRLLWLGASSLAVFAVCTFLVMRHQPVSNHSEYLTQILNARVDPGVNPNATVSFFQTKDEDRVTVLWVDGLKSLPSEYAAK